MSHESSNQVAPAIFVIFGVTGNLAQKRLLPALYHLLKDDLLHEHTMIVGISRKAMTAEELLDKVELCVLEEDKVCDPVVLGKFRERLQMVQLDPVVEADYDRLRQALDAIEDQHGLCMNRLFYLSIPPQVYEPVIENLGTQGLSTGCQHRRGHQQHDAQGAAHSGAVSRLLVEKPFGYDLISARELIEHTAKYFDEEQVFRIDHYLAKETAQNIVVFRKHNPVFANVWSSRSVSSIEIILSEQIGVEGRAEFYDNVGALRDVVQNHVLQLLALATMELNDTDSDSLHAAKQQLLSDIATVDPNSTPVIRGQYRGYQEEVNNPGSTTETYVSLTIHIDNDRWRGMPVQLTAGKALDAKRTAITLNFIDDDNAHTMNRLTFRIQPNDGIDVALTVKRPGFDEKTDEATMDFSYANAFGTANHPDAYERVLLDAVRGDHSLFATSSEVLESWRILQPILTHWEQSGDDLRYYEPGSTGPVKA